MWVGEYIVLNLVIAVVIGGVVEAEEREAVRVEGRARRKSLGARSARDDDDSASSSDEDEEHQGAEGGGTAEGSGGGADGEAGGGVSGGGGGARGRCCGGWLEADVSLGLFPRDSWVRRLCAWIVKARLCGTPITLEVVVITNIVATSFLVAVTGGCDVGHDGRYVAMDPRLLVYLDVTLLISLAELSFKVVANGLLFTPDAYLKSGWHQIDALIALLCVGEVLSARHHTPDALVMRSIHVLRPIRLIARLEGLKNVIELLLRVMPRVVNILLVYCLFLVVFAILGVQLFAGKFGGCPADEALASRAACLAAGHAWESSPDVGSFDDVLSSALVLFEISSLEGWPVPMYLGIDAVGVDLAGERDHNWFASLYFIAWVILGGFVVLNVFVGVLIDTFATMNRDQQFGSIFTSEQQRQWVETLETMTAVRPKRSIQTPRSSCRQPLFRLVLSPRFESLILLVILFNTALMPLDSYGAPDSLHRLLDLGNDACTVVFTLEMLSKLCALGVGQYFAEAWNVFDFLVVMLALFEVAIKTAAEQGSALLGGGGGEGGGSELVKGSLLRVARLARAARVLRTVRAVRSSRSIRSLLTTLLYSILPLANILGIFAIVAFIYAVLGMELFGGVLWGEYLNAEANFCSFPAAMLTMFRSATGENWNGIMHDAMVTPERGCDPAADNCGSIAAVPFFVSYVILTTFIVLKMMVALIIENFKLSIRENGRLVRAAQPRTRTSQRRTAPGAFLARRSTAQAAALCARVCSRRCAPPTATPSSRRGRSSTRTAPAACPSASCRSSSDSCARRSGCSPSTSAARRSDRPT